MKHICSCICLHLSKHLPKPAVSRSKQMNVLFPSAGVDTVGEEDGGGFS